MRKNLQQRLKLYGRISSSVAQTEVQSNGISLLIEGEIENVKNERGGERERNRNKNTKYYLPWFVFTLQTYELTTDNIHMCVSIVIALTTTTTTTIIVFIQYYKVTII